MTIVSAILLGFVEGVTEFLPISSTGHLILTSKLLGIQPTDFTKSFEVIVQLGAIAAVAVVYYHKLFELKKLWKPLAIAFIPSALVGLTLYRVIKSFLLGNDMLVAVTLILGGIILLFIEDIAFKKTSQDGTPNTMQAFKIGLGQALSIIPGVSRSAATIIFGGLAGLSKKSAVEFSFLLAIPTMLAATALDLLKMETKFSSDELVILAVGLITAFITALVAIKFFLNYIQNNSFKIFGWYRIAIGIAYLIIMTAYLK